jgi:UDP-N-acetylmuramoyl-L-alanyl-D-glutamate--2,6-diaminopimelate ligase
MRLSELARAAGAQHVGGDPDVAGLAIDSRRVDAGHLFVALPGAHQDGAAFIPDALRRGAVAVCATRPVAGVPTVVADDPRRALAAMAAALHGYPARELTLIGITGSLGKTSTALLIEAMLAASGVRIGVIGSLGIRYDGTRAETGMTTPEAPLIHGALREMVRHDVRAAVMEVTTHSILHHRVTGLEFDLGVITNLIANEHLEFHPTPEHYVRTKTRFFGMLRAGAPLVLNADDATVRAVTGALHRPLVGVTAAWRRDAAVAVDGLHMEPKGSAFSLWIARPLPRLGGGVVEPATLALTLPILGPQQVTNAALAATAALIAGASPDGVAAALARVRPIRRRMEVITDAGPFVLDDTVGNPASIEAVFQTARALPHERVRIAYAIRGMRGVSINAHNASALAAGVAATGAALTVTSSEDAADERNRVTEEERTVVLEILERAGVPFHFTPLLEEAVTRTLADCGAGDLVLLLGAQGMDRGAEIARRVLKLRGTGNGERGTERG